MNIIVFTKRTHVGLRIILLLCVLILDTTCSHSSESDVLVKLQFSKSSLSLEVNERDDLNITISEPLNNDTEIYFIYGISGKDYTNPKRNLIGLLDNFTIPANSTNDVSVTVVAKHAGHMYLGLNSTSQEIIGINKSYVSITIVNSMPLSIFSDVIGWMYFAAWSISFYPQVILNFRRRSVVGLSFDFLALNFVGFLLYSLFNIGFYFITKIQDEYRVLHPRGIIPVEINDVVFAVHALLLTIVTIGQCFFYTRNGQRLSRVCICILIVIGVATIVVFGVKLGHVMQWIDLLYYFSYVKLGITIIKYMPQAYFNYRRKSTMGWSIGNILLDFTGGSLSLLQMFILAYNSDDWTSLFGNPTKFGLGFVSLLFDILFMVQHYCLYRHSSNYTNIESNEKIDDKTDDNAVQ